MNWVFYNYYITSKIILLNPIIEKIEIIQIYHAGTELKKYKL